MTATFRMPPAGSLPFVMLLVVLAAVGIGMNALLRQVGTPVLVRVLVGAVLCAAVAAVGASAVGSRTARFELSPAGLRLRGDMYGRLVPADRLRAAEARAVDLATERALRPTARTFGTGLPGYNAGWFRLANGERALVYVTDATRAVHVPTSDGYALLLSVEDPAALVAALHDFAARRPRT
jgi:hypothetical protein